jgi:hypothetical protein
VIELEETIRGLVELIKTSVENVGFPTQPLSNQQLNDVGVLREGFTQLKRCCRVTTVTVALMLISLCSELDALPVKIDKIRKRSRLKLLFRKKITLQLKEAKGDLVNAKQNFKVCVSFREYRAQYGLMMSNRQRRTMP